MVRRFREIARHGDPDLVLIDGEHLVADALGCRIPIEVALSDGRAPELAARARDAGADVYDCTAGVLEAASPVRTPSGIVALARWRLTPLDRLLARTGLCLGLAGVQDPGNVGSAIRAADALGAAGVVVLDGTADPRAWKTLRGAMGSAFRVPVARASAEEVVREARAQGRSILATVAAGGTPVDRADLVAPALLLVGSEGAGLPAELVDTADQRVTIPMRAGVESLNVAVTAAIVLFEARRQHQSAATQP